MITNSRMTHRTVGQGMKRATMTAGTADRIGPNIGISSNIPASTPSTTKYGKPRRKAGSYTGKSADNRRHDQLAAQIAAHDTRRARAYDSCTARYRLGTAYSVFRRMTAALVRKYTEMTSTMTPFITMPPIVDAAPTRS